MFKISHQTLLSEAAAAEYFLKEHVEIKNMWTCFHLFFFVLYVYILHFSRTE